MLQKCTDVLERVSGLCTETCLTASDVKLEEDSDMPEEEDPLAVTSPAVKAEQEVSNVCITCQWWDSNGACWGDSAVLCVGVMSVQWRTEWRGLGCSNPPPKF